MSAEVDVAFITEYHTVPLVITPCLVLMSERQTFGYMLICKRVLDTSHSTQETCFIQTTTDRTIRDLCLQLGIDLPGGCERVTGGQINDRLISMTVSDSVATSSMHILQRVVLSELIGPSRSGPGITACQLLDDVD